MKAQTKRGRGALTKMFVLTVGPPGAGKTTLLAERYPDALVLCPDDEGTPSSFRGFFKALHSALIAGRRKQIVVDRTNPRLNQRTQMLDAARAAGYPTQIIYMPAEPDTCLQRIRACKNHPLKTGDARARDAERALGRYVDDLVPPTDGEADRLETIGAPAPAGKPPAADGPGVSETIIDKIVLLMIAGLRTQAVVDACTEKLQIPQTKVEGAMAKARRLITRAAEYDRDEILGEAISRLDDLYQRSLRVQDIKTALAAQREKDRLLLGMVAPGGEPGRDPGPETQGDPEPTGDPKRGYIESDQLASIVAAIESDIEPLSLLTDNIHITDAELISLAGEEIRRYRRKEKRANAKPRAKKPKAKKSTKPKPKKGKQNENA